MKEESKDCLGQIEMPTGNNSGDISGVLGMRKVDSIIRNDLECFARKAQLPKSTQWFDCSEFIT